MILLRICERYTEFDIDIVRFSDSFQQREMYKIFLIANLAGNRHHSQNTLLNLDETCKE